MQEGTLAKRDVAVQCLESLLARPECRPTVWATPGIVKRYEHIYLMVG